ncbi:phage tail protein [Achromobacter denitrificans]|uniref:phage tail protein n=2 Tax=Achromobacter denitrificans TaxID=32002 RepID=UPI00240E0E40|nr:phage tail protein [Achromobacter denitrificans]WFC70389.1 phage tail protein [Achromobacter denitrificans]
MDLLIAPNTVTQERADTAPATGTPGWATDGNPATNTPATQWPAYAFNAIQAELMGVIQAPGDIDPDRHDNGQVAAAIKRLIAVAVQNRPLCFSISDLPTEDVGPIVVAECGEVWIWSQSAYFTGYRSPLCGRPVDGHTLAPLASEVDAVGGLLPKVAYARLWGYARENGLVVSQAFWDANKGGHYFVDVDANTFRVPDLRDMFRRFTGTDADTANARVMGSRQLDALQKITGTFGVRNTVDFTDESGAFYKQQQAAVSTAALAGGSGAVMRFLFDSSRVSRSSTETRSVSVGYGPRVHA